MITFQKINTLECRQTILIYFRKEWYSKYWNWRGNGHGPIQTYFNFSISISFFIIRLFSIGECTLRNSHPIKILSKNINICLIWEKQNIKEILNRTKLTHTNGKAFYTSWQEIWLNATFVELNIAWISARWWPNYTVNVQDRLVFAAHTS